MYKNIGVDSSALEHIRYQHITGTFWQSSYIMVNAVMDKL